MIVQIMAHTESRAEQGTASTAERRSDTDNGTDVQAFAIEVRWGDETESAEAALIVTSISDSTTAAANL